MSQSIWFSLNEQIVNTTLGLLVGFLFLVLVINPLFSLTLTFIASIEVSIIMYLVSLIRGLIFRRVFVRIENYQSMKHSITEKVIDVGVGFVIATTVWSYVLMSSYDILIPLWVNITINIMFFIVNLVRSLIVRRVFENIHRKRLTEDIEHV